MKKNRQEVDDIDRRVAHLSRRGFFLAATAAAAGYGGWRWLMSRELEQGVQRPFRRVLEFNERLSQAYFDPKRLSPQFPLAEAAPTPRVNGHIGLDAKADHSSWKLRIDGSPAGEGIELSLDDIRALPRYDMVTELRCIEGWSVIVHWTGARLTDLMKKFPPPTRNGSRPDFSRRPDELVRYVSMETPGRQYYVGLDMPSALHPQTLLAYEINHQPLSWNHGAPLRLAIPVKYGIKNIKRLATIRYTDTRPADFWGERGYDWYAGH
jgi:DMSO/TMAO reductase YedYZ molybdopterin-dependent catalytic subunit